MVVICWRGLSSQRLALDRQTATLLIGKPKPPLAQLPQEDLDFCVLKVNPLLLIEVDPAGQGHQQKLPGFQDEAHGAPHRSRGCAKIASANGVRNRPNGVGETAIQGRS